MNVDAHKHTVLRDKRELALRVAGFSLVELMVALALSTFLIGALILTYQSGRAASRDAEDLSRVQENMRFVSDHLLRDIRNAGFRDQLTLTFDQYEAIGGAYAARSADGSELTIRYAGRSHCAQARREFDVENPADELGVVTNTYRIPVDDPNSRLQCAGEWAGSDPEINPETGTVPVVAGVNSISFEFIRSGAPPSSPDDLVCDFNTDAALANACIGVEVTVTFGGDGGEREAVFVSSFRNVLLDHIYGRN